MAVDSLPRPMKWLRVMANSRDHKHRYSLVTEMVLRARRAQFTHATLRGTTAGLGRLGSFSNHHLFGEDVPPAILIVGDHATEIEPVLEGVRPEIDDSLVVLDELVASRG